MKYKSLSKEKYTVFVENPEILRENDRKICGKSQNNLSKQLWI